MRGHAAEEQPIVEVVKHELDSARLAGPASRCRDIDRVAATQGSPNRLVHDILRWLVDCSLQHATSLHRPDRPGFLTDSRRESDLLALRSLLRLPGTFAGLVRSELVGRVDVAEGHVVRCE